MSNLIGTCMKSAYKQALKTIAKQNGFSKRNKVPKNARASLRSNARRMAATLCRVKI